MPEAEPQKRGNTPADTKTQELGLLAKLVLAALIVLALAGLLLHGITVEVMERLWHDLIERPDAPMRFRFILQPVMAAIVAIRHGLIDVRAGRTPYFRKALGVARLREGLNATARIILLGIVMDAMYQIIVLGRFYPGEAVIIALVLAFVPYLLIRGPAARIARRRHADPRHHRGATVHVDRRSDTAAPRRHREPEAGPGRSARRGVRHRLEVRAPGR